MPPSCSYNSLESADRREITYSSPADLSQLLSIDRLGVKRTTQTTRVGKSFLTYAESVAKTTEASSSESQDSHILHLRALRPENQGRSWRHPRSSRGTLVHYPSCRRRSIDYSVSLFPRFDSPTL